MLEGNYTRRGRLKRDLTITINIVILLGFAALGTWELAHATPRRMVAGVSFLLLAVVVANDLKTVIRIRRLENGNVRIEDGTLTITANDETKKIDVRGTTILLNKRFGVIAIRDDSGRTIAEISKGNSVYCDILKELGTKT